MKNLENNKLIADFMGIRYEENRSSHESSDYYFEDCELAYHTSWDWLMPVIDKITSLDEYVEFKNDTSSMVDEGGVYINTRFIENTYNETVEFIKWYNKNK